MLAAAIEGAQAAEISETTVDAPLSEIANGNFSINVHESAENIENYIACGEIGTLADGDRVAVGLRELNTSGYVGIAVLTANGDQTDVTVYLASGLSGDTQATAAAGHEHEDAAEAAAVTVDIQDFAYNPDPVTIAAGESITWTNQDEAPHTATASDRDILQSGTLQQGDSYTQSFDTAGTYEYFCEFHAGMNGTIIVE